MPRWSVELTGNPTDLARLPAMTATTSLPVESRGAGFYLTSEGFEKLEDAHEVMMLAEKVAKMLTGVLVLQGKSLTPIGIGAIQETDPEGGPPKQVVFGAAELRPPRHNLDVEAQGWIATAANPEGPESRALRLSANPTGSNLYTIVEIVGDEVGGIPGIENQEWAPRGELARFKHTVQHHESAGDDARHGATKTQPPRNPMAMREARRLVRRVLTKWLETRNPAPGTADE